MMKCDSCETWLDEQSDAVPTDDGILCQECATQYGEGTEE